MFTATLIALPPDTLRQLAEAPVQCSGADVIERRIGLAVLLLTAALPLLFALLPA